MKVSYINYVHDKDGGWIHVTEFAKAFKGLGHEISVHWQDLAPNESVSGNYRSSSRVRRFLARYLHQPKEVLKNVPRFRGERGVMRREMPDVVLVRHHPLTCSAVLAAEREHLPIVLEVNAVHDLESKKYYKQYRNLPWAPKAIERMVFRRADAITVVSDFLKDHLLESYGVEESRVFVNPNGVDVERFAVSEDMRGREVQVGFVGTFQAYHAIEMLLAVIESVASTGAPLRFLLVGDGPYKKEFLCQLEKKGLHDRVEDAGRLSYMAIPECIARMDICLMPGAAQYGSPLKVMEYMSAGRAVVAPRMPPIAAVIKHRSNGLLFEPGNLDDFVKKVLQLGTDVGLRERVGREAAKTIRSGYTWRHNALRVESCCLAAIQHRRQQGSPSCQG